MRNSILLAFVAFTLQAIAQSPCQQGTILINGSSVDAITMENDNNSGLVLPLWLKEGTSLAAGDRVLLISVIEFDIVNQTVGNSLVFNQVLQIGTQTASVPEDKTWKVESIVKHANVLATGFTASSNSPVCQNEPLNLSATSVPDATYQWTGPNGFTSNVQNPVISSASLAASGTYTVSAVLNGCISAPTSTTVIVNSQPISTFTISPSAVTTNVNTTFIPTVSGATYSWIFNSGNPASGTAENPVVQWSSAGNYDVAMTITDENGCSADSLRVISVSDCIPGQPSSSFTWAPQVIRPNQAVTFSPDVSGASYSWIFNGGSPGVSTSENPEITWTSSGNYTVSLQVTSSNGCTTTETAAVTVSDPVMVTFTANGSGRTGTIQNFTVPQGVTSVTIEARGAQGANGLGQGGKGARVIGTCSVTPGEVLKILVGQQGTPGPSNYVGGGGGTFVATSSNVPLVVAGGGGGGGNPSTSGGVGSDGQASENGASSSGGIAGGSGGNGGSGGAGGGGGGGFYTDGGTGNTCNLNGGSSFINGGFGALPTSPSNSGEGGYGGGGSGDGQCCGGSGAGGGYSGGGGGKTSCGGVIGGGGGSYNSGTNQTNEAGYQEGNGQVILTY